MGLNEVPTHGEDGTVHVVIECPRGAAVKLKFDPRMGAMTLSRPLPAGLTYPHDWGFVPGTCAPDGDPLDALVICDVGTAPGVVVPCRLLGVLELEQDRKNGGGRERNDRLIAVPAIAPRFETVADVSALPERLRDEIAQFFVSATVFEAKRVRILGWAGASSAVALLERSKVRQPHPSGRERTGQC
jgi:inorganic pyrophosphatase